MIPDWVKGAVFYQIFPDRFANADPGNDPPNVRSWGSPPTISGYQGGDLAGIIANMDYLVELGINAIYLNPIFLSSSTHRYNTNDYFKIDPMLGNLDIFKQLIDRTHALGIKVILDGVFNHTGRGFFAFVDILENGEESPYKDWYHIHHFPVDAYSAGKARDYEAWWGYKSLPKLNTDNPDVRKFIFSVARYWLSQGADGWRLDVPNEINDDVFWAEFRRQVKDENPDAFLLGEIWDISPRWLEEGYFDSLMDYPLRDGLIEFLSGKTSSIDIQNKLFAMWALYPPGSEFSLYNLTGSHDTERILTLLQNNTELVKLIFLFLFTFPGIPAIYYGDEIGLTGGKDPASRRAFNWNTGKQNRELLSWAKKLIQLRKIFQTLQTGSYIPLTDEKNPHIFAYFRTDEARVFLILINRSSRYENIQLDLQHPYFHQGKVLNNLLGDETIAVDGNGDRISFTLAPQRGYLFL